MAGMCAPAVFHSAPPALHPPSTAAAATFCSFTPNITITLGFTPQQSSSHGATRHGLHLMPTYLMAAPSKKLNVTLKLSVLLDSIAKIKSNKASAQQ